MYQITWRGQPFDATEEETVLQAAERAGLAVPSSCRNGTCRTCLQQLASGDIVYLVDWPGVSADERIDGYFLPCVCCPATDLVVV
jgi:ferredoxin